jgi:hypothetical protein
MADLCFGDECLPESCKRRMLEFGEEQVRDHTRGRDPLLFSHGHHANHLIAQSLLLFRLAPARQFYETDGSGRFRALIRGP